jgi:arylsulfatase A-like enzyme
MPMPMPWPWCLLLLAVAAGDAAPQAPPPHIVFILADDLGFNDLQGFGAGNRMQTPQIAALREVGVRLGSFYTFKFCSPSRSQTLTGRFAYHLGQQTQLNLNPMTGCEWDSTLGTRSAYMCSIKCGLSLNYTMLPALLKTARAPYSTHAYGKWHQGFFKRAYTPTFRGFDTYFGSYTNNDHWTHVDPYGANPSRLCPGWTPTGNRTAGGCTVTQNQTCPSAHTRAPDGSCHTCVLYDLSNSSGAHIRNANLSLNGTYAARVYGHEAARTIHAHAASHSRSAAADGGGAASAASARLPLQPLFLYVAFTVVHSPNEAPAESIARYAETVPSAKRALFGGMVWELDVAVGAIAAALKDTRMWLNTCFVFTTDNGSPLSNGGNNAPLRGSKVRRPLRPFWRPF